MCRKRLAPHQFVPVRSYQCNIFRGDIEINTVHHRAKLVIGRGKNGTIDAIQQNISIQFYANGIITKLRRLRKFFSILSHQTILAVLILNGYLQIIEIDIKRQRLLRYFLQSIEQRFGRHSETSVGITFIYLQSSYHGGFTIRYCDGQRPVLQLEKETI